MGQLVFAIDLDGTVMHSHRDWSPGDVCVELIGGEERGFMRADMYRVLKRACEVGCVVPVTSRSVEQFERIRWADIKVSLSYVANGGIRIEGDGGDAIRLIGTLQWKPTLDDVATAIARDNRVNRCRIIDSCYVLAYLSDPAVDISDMRRYCGDELTMYRDRKKLYFFPAGLSKGLAIADIRTWIPDARIVCIGDSENDFPMLELADLAILPAMLFEATASNGKLSAFAACPAGEPFEEFVINSIASVSGLDSDSWEGE